MCVDLFLRKLIYMSMIFIKLALECEVNKLIVIFTRKCPGGSSSLNTLRGVSAFSHIAARRSDDFWRYHSPPDI